MSSAFQLSLPLVEINANSIAYLSHGPQPDCDINCWVAYCYTQQEITVFYQELDKTCPVCGKAGTVNSTYLEQYLTDSNCNPRPGEVRVIRSGMGNQFQTIY